MGGDAANNKVINCDSYYNVDPGQGNADGFAVKLDVGTDNSYSGCRAWQNSDDGWDGYMRPSDDVSTTLDNCWAFKNGYLESGAVATNGNGNGFKMGSSDAKDLRHNFTLTHCLSFSNTANGYDQNSNLGNITLLNCTAFNNGKNYRYDVALAAGKLYTLKNCILAGTGGYSSWITTALSASPSTTVPVQVTNSWNTGIGVATTADFVSVDPTAAYGARQADGSLPTFTFMHLATGSHLINKGTDIGLAFNGSAPDLGCFETAATVPVTLIDFKATLKDKNVVLNWTIATELNNAGWHIERSTTGKDDWQNIDFVKGNGTTNTPQYFSFLDNNPLLNTNCYRLKQTDFDEQTTLSKVVSVALTASKKETPSVYPNPIMTDASIALTLSQPSAVTLTLFNELGQLVSTVLSETKTSGTHLLTLKTAHILRGVYFVVLTTNEGVEMVRFVKN